MRAFLRRPIIDISLTILLALAFPIPISHAQMPRVQTAPLPFPPPSTPTPPPAPKLLLPRERLREVIQNRPLQPTATPKSPLRFFSSLVSWEALGVLIPTGVAVVGWILVSRKRGRFRDYFDRIDDTYAQFKMKSRRCEAELYRLEDLIEDELKQGKLDESTYQLLRERLEKYLAEVRQQIIREQFGELPQTLEQNLNDMLVNREVSKEEYHKFLQLLNKTTAVGKEKREEIARTVKHWKEEDSRLTVT